MTRCKALLAIVVALAVVGVLAPSSARAVPVPLTDLLGGASLTVDDKVFSGFSASAVNIDVTTLAVETLINPALGEGFAIVGLPALGPGAAASLDLIFSVAVVDPAFEITGIAGALLGDGVTGTGTAALSQSVFDFSANLIGANLISLPGGPPVGSAALGTGVTNATVREVLTLSAGEDGTVNIPIVAQFVSQTAVPEPSVLLLLSAGAGALALGLRRR